MAAVSLSPVASFALKGRAVAPRERCQEPRDARLPDEVRNKVIADGNAAWLDELPSVVESLAQEWSLTIGATLRGGHAALVVEATLADGTAAVLKVGVPGTRRDLTFEATALRLADGDGCASLLRDDLDRERAPARATRGGHVRRRA